MNKNQNCDGSHCWLKVGEVRALPYQWDKDGTVLGNLIVCQACYWHKMAYRYLEHPKMARPKWNTLEIYKGA